MPFPVILASLGILYIIAVFQALLIAFYLFFQKRGVAKSRFILALLMIDFAVFLTGTFMLLYFGWWRHIYYAHLANLTVFLAPPLLYFYYRSLVDERFKLSYKLLVHVIPFFIIFCYMFYVIVFQLNRNFVFRPFGIVLIGSLFIQSIYYLRLMYIEKQRANAGKPTNAKDKWFGFLFFGVFLIFVFKLAIFIIWNILDRVDICIFLTGAFFILTFIMINTLVIYSLFNPELLINYFKYQSSTLSAGLKNSRYAELVNLLDQNKLYLDPLLSLDKLSRPLNLSGKQLSQLINENAGINFNDFINKYRIKEAQELIKNNTNQQQNILAIAYEVGFNSKSTFNTAFKKFTNSTPSEYRKSVL